jgi:predicted Zn-dependent protease
MNCGISPVRALAASALAVLVAACAGAPRAPAPVEERAAASTPAAVPHGAPAEPEPVFEEIREAPSGPQASDEAALEPALVALLDESERKRRAGQDEAAAATVERALRISPGNATLWHRLAEIRLDQGRLSQAEALAQKSMSLSDGDQRLQAGNWRLIARARAGLGDAAGARAAENAAARIESSFVD